jgi:mycothiol synthase
MLGDNWIIHPPVMADLDAVVDLINTCARADIGTDNITPARLRTLWTDERFQLATDAWIVATRDGRLAGYADFGDEEPPETYQMSGYVHPDYGGRGIGTHLLGLIEQRARQAMIDAPPDLRIALQNGIYATNAGAHELLEHEGYALVRRWYKMLIQMDAPPPAPKVPEGITIRTFRLGEEDRAMHAAYEEAMADEWEHPPLSYERWRHYNIDAEPNFDPTLWFLATDGDQIAGLALCRWERPGEPDQGHVRDIGVRPAWRRRGIGLALLRYTFGEFYRRGKRRVGLGVDATSLTGADRLYRKAGMHVLLETLIYEKELRPGKREA